MAAQAKNKTILEEFMAGCKKGFYVGAENIMPAMVLAYALILFLQISGLMDIIASARRLPLLWRCLACRARRLWR